MSSSLTPGTLQKFRDEHCLEEASPCGNKLGCLVCFGKHIKKAGEGEKHIHFHFREMLIMAFWTGAGWLSLNNY